MEGVTIVLPNHREARCVDTYAALLGALNAREDLRSVPILVAHDPFGRGVGWALREGLRDVTTPWVVFAMADGSEDPACVAKMVAHCEAGMDAVWGDRWTPPGQVVGYPIVKRVLNRLGNYLIRWTQGGSYTDWTDLAKGYRVDRLRSLSWSNDFRCEIEIPICYLRQCPQPARIVCVPMRWTERQEGRSSFKLRQVWRMAWTLVHVLWEGRAP